MAPWPGRLSSVTQITIATDEAVVVVEWSLSGRKLFPGQSTPGKMGLWVDFWGNGSRGRDRLGRRMNLVVAKTMSTVQLLLAKLKERVIWPDIMFMIIRSVEYFFGPNISKTNNFLPNTNSPPGLPSDKANPTLPPPPATTCDHLPPPPPQHVHPHHQPSTTFCPSFAASSTSNDDDHREPSNPGTAHNLLFKRHDDERFTHRAPRFPSSPPTSHLASDSIAPGRPNSLAARRRTTTTPPNQTKPKPNNRNHEPPSSKENRRQGTPPAPIHPLLPLPPTIPN